MVATAPGEALRENVRDLPPGARPKQAHAVRQSPTLNEPVIGVSANGAWVTERSTGYFIDSRAELFAVHVPSPLWPCEQW